MSSEKLEPCKEAFMWVHEWREGTKDKVEDRLSKMAWMAEDALYQFCLWWEKRPESQDHEITRKAIDFCQGYINGINRLIKAGKIVRCEECGFAKAIDREDENFRNVCPTCMFCWEFMMCVIMPSVRDHGCFPPPLTKDEAFEAASKGFPFAGLADNAPESIRPLMKLTFG